MTRLHGKDLHPELYGAYIAVDSRPATFYN